VPAGTGPRTVSASGDHFTIVNGLIRATTWRELERSAELALGPSSFYLGVCYGILENLASSVKGLVDLLRVFVLAGLYERAQHPAWIAAGLPDYLIAKVAELTFGSQLKKAHDQCLALLSELKYAVTHPGELFGAIANQYAAKWKRFQSLVVDSNLGSQFEAGKIAGEVLLDVLMLIGVGEAAVKFAAKLPELAKLAEQFGEALKVGSRVRAAAAGGVAETSEVSKAFSTTSRVFSPSEETAVVRTYGRNTGTWITDAQGRPTRVDATLRESSSGLERSPDEAAAQRVAAATGKEGDVGGHIIGHRFMADQGSKNLFPQEANFNNSAYKKMENELADWTKKGNEVYVTVTLEPPGAARPDVVKVAFEVVDPATGETVNFHAEKFNNEAGQGFNRVGIKDMEGQ
jgi:hypothetical protein